MTTPTGRVLTLAIPAHLGPIKDNLDAPSYTASGFGLCRPNRLQHFEHERGLNCLNREISDDWLGVCAERSLPLCGMLAVAPAGAMRLDVAFGTFLERYGFGRIEPCLQPLDA